MRDLFLAIPLDNHGYLSPSPSTPLSLSPTAAHSRSRSLSQTSADFVAVDFQLTFPSMSPLGSTQCVTITITDDVITEPEQTFYLTLVPVSDFIVVGEASTSSVVIDDDDCGSH